MGKEPDEFDPIKQEVCPPGFLGIPFNVEGLPDGRTPSRIGGRQPLATLRFCCPSADGRRQPDSGRIRRDGSAGPSAGDRRLPAVVAGEDDGAVRRRPFAVVIPAHADSHETPVACKTPGPSCCRWRPPAAGVWCRAGGPSAAAAAISRAPRPARRRSGSNREGEDFRVAAGGLGQDEAIGDAAGRRQSGRTSSAGRGAPPSRLRSRPGPSVRPRRPTRMPSPEAPPARPHRQARPAAAPDRRDRCPCRAACDRSCPYWPRRRRGYRVGRAEIERRAAGPDAPRRLGQPARRPTTAGSTRSCPDIVRTARPAAERGGGDGSGGISDHQDRMPRIRRRRARPARASASASSGGRRHSGDPSGCGDAEPSARPARPPPGGRARRCEGLDERLLPAAGRRRRRPRRPAFPPGRRQHGTPASSPRRCCSRAPGRSRPRRQAPAAGR